MITVQIGDGMEERTILPGMVETLEEIVKLDVVYYRTQKWRVMSLKFVKWTTIGKEKAALFKVLDERHHFIKILARRVVGSLFSDPNVMC